MKTTMAKIHSALSCKMDVCYKCSDIIHTHTPGELPVCEPCREKLQELWFEDVKQKNGILVAVSDNGRIGRHNSMQENIKEQY